MSELRDAHNHDGRTQGPRREKSQGEWRQEWRGASWLGRNGAKVPRGTDMAWGSVASAGERARPQVTGEARQGGGRAPRRTRPRPFRSHTACSC